MYDSKYKVFMACNYHAYEIKIAKYDVAILAIGTRFNVAGLVVF